MNELEKRPRRRSGYKVIEPRVIDVLTSEEIKHPDGSIATHSSNDVTYVVDQNRLLKFNPETVKSILSDFSSRSLGVPDPAEYETSLSLEDEELMYDSIKSRYIQSHCDLKEYTAYLKHNYDEECDNLRREYEFRKSKKEKELKEAEKLSKEKEYRELKVKAYNAILNNNK